MKLTWRQNIRLASIIFRVQVWWPLKKKLTHFFMGKKEETEKR